MTASDRCPWCRRLVNPRSSTVGRDPDGILWHGDCSKRARQMVEGMVLLHPARALAAGVDPDALLAMLRRLVGDVDASGDHEPWAQAFDALDWYISQGGPPPWAWAGNHGQQHSGGHDR